MAEAVIILSPSAVAEFRTNEGSAVVVQSMAAATVEIAAEGTQGPKGADGAKWEELGW